MDFDSIVSESTTSDTSSEGQVVKRFVCPQCDRKFSTLYSKNRHVNNLHEMENESELTHDNESSASETSNAHSSASETSNAHSSAIDGASSETDNDDEEESHDEESMTEDCDNDESMSDDEDDDAYPFEDLVEKALRCHEQEYSKLASRQQDGDDMKEMSDLKSRVSKTLRELFVDYLQDLEAKRKDPLFQAIMRKANQLKEDEDFQMDDAIAAAVAFLKYNINKLIPWQHS